MTTEQANASEAESKEDSSLDANDPDVDVDALNAAIAASGEEAQAKVDLANIKRAVGHIPGLQKSLDTVTKEIGKIQNLERSNAALASRLDTLISAIPDGLLPASAANSLRPAVGDSNSEVLTKIAELEARLNPEPKAEVDEDPRTAVWRAQLETAQETVSEYGKKNSFDVATIPDAVYTRALAANANNVSLATLDVIKYIDQQVAAAGRRGERKEAGSGGQVSRNARSGPVTLAQMATMTLDEVRAIPAAEREAALTAAG